MISNSDLVPKKPLVPILAAMSRLSSRESLWMAATVFSVVSLFTIMTIDQRIRNHILVESVMQVLLAIGFTALSITSFLPVNRDSAGPIEKNFRIGLAIQTLASLIDTTYKDNGIIYQTITTYVGPIACLLLIVVGYQQSCKSLRIISALTRLIPLLVAASTFVLVLILLATTNIHGFSTLFSLLLEDRIIARFAFGLSVSIWIYVVSYHTKKNSPISLSMKLSALILLLVHLFMVLFFAQVPPGVYFNLRRLALFMGCVISSASIFKAHLEAYEKMNSRMRKSVNALKETKIKLNSSSSSSTEFKNLQTDLQHARTMLTGKDELLINLTQELRTLLNGEMGNIELLIESKLSPLQQDYAIALEKSVDGLIALINNTITFVRADTGRIIIDESTSFKVGKLLDRVLDNKQKFKSDIDVYYTIDENVPEALLGDANILEMILNHLLDNAIKFTHKGEVAIKVSAIRGGDRDVFLSVQVKDTGKGIPKLSLAGLGNPFYSLRENGCGSGLGVAISDRLARLFKSGKLKISSEANKGSSFTFSGLFREADAASPHQENHLHKSIVCVDDNLNVVTAIQSMMQRFTLSSVRGVTSFQEAEKMILQLEDEGQLPDALLLDYTLPGPNGVQLFCTDLARKIKENPRTKAVNIIVMVSTEQRKSLLLPHVDGYLTKPIRCKQLLNILRKFGSTRDSSPSHSDRLGSSDSDHMLSASSDDRISARDAFLSAADGDASKLHILVAEDNLLNQEVVKRIVQSVGFTTKITQNGEECVEEFKKGNYDLVLMDCLMPVLSGFEATIQIRKWEQMNGLKHTPIIALTATDSPGTRSHCLSVGMDDYLIKPVKKSVLEKLLKDYLNKRQKMVENKPQPATETGLHLLLVEDNPINAKIATRLLEKYHWKVDLATDGKQALDFVMSNYYKYSVVLMDIHLPIMDGLTCTTLIRQFEKDQMLSAKPIIALTADTMSSHKNQCLKAGCTEYMNKPIDYPLLVALLERYNKRNLPASPEGDK